MKVFVFFFALVAFVAAQDIDDHPLCIDCGVTEDVVLFPHPDHCDRYYQCVPGGGARDMPCPAPLYYNEKERVCDWKCNVNCGSRALRQ